MRHIMLTLLAGTALTLAACGSDNSGSYGTANPSPVSTVAVKAATNPLGHILVNPAGLTLYAFTKDVDAKSACTGACAATWPPVIVSGDLAVGNGLTAQLFKVVDRPDGKKQLEAGKWPLYTFAGDAAPGDTNGQASGGFWFVVSTDGTLVKA